jgi:hypothetical protein
MPKAVKAGLEHLTARFALTGDVRRIVVIRATDDIPTGELSADRLLAAWWFDRWAPSTTMILASKLVEVRLRTGCGLPSSASTGGRCVRNSRTTWKCSSNRQEGMA